jgi:hypothetical protein
MGLMRVAGRWTIDPEARGDLFHVQAKSDALDGPIAWLPVRSQGSLLKILITRASFEGRPSIDHKRATIKTRPA